MAKSRSWLLQQNVVKVWEDRFHWCLKNVSASVASSRLLSCYYARLWCAADADHWRNLFSTKITLPLSAPVVPKAYLSVMGSTSWLLQRAILHAASELQTSRSGVSGGYLSLFNYYPKLPLVTGQSMRRCIVQLLTVPLECDCSLGSGVGAWQCRHVQLNTLGDNQGDFSQLSKCVFK